MSSLIVGSKGGLCQLSYSVGLPFSMPQFFKADILVAAWLGSLVNGPIADGIGRKLSINLAVVIFVIGSAIQCAAVNIPMLFIGR